MKFLLICLFSIFSICGFAQNLPKFLWKIVYVDSEEKNEDVTGSGLASCIIDNNRNTFWTTSYKDKHTPPPHTVVIDLGATASVKSFDFYPRQERYNGKISDYSIYASMDNQQWNILQKGRFNYKSMYDGNAQHVALSRPCKARYIRFVAESELSQKALSIHLAEINIQGTYISAVFAPLIHVEKSTIVKNEAVQFSDSSFVQNTKIRSREWHFPGGTPSVSSEQNPIVHYTTSGTHSVSLTVTSKEGIKKTTSLPNAVDCLPAPLVPRNNWKLSVSEQELILAHDSADNMIDNKPRTLWHTAYISDKKLPHFIVIDLGQETEISGIGYLPRQGGGENGIFRAYRIFVSNDTLNFGKSRCQVKEPKPYTSLQIVEFAPVKGRYLKIEIDQTFPEGSNFASASELYIYGEHKEYSHLVWIAGGLLILLISAGIFYRTRKKKETATTVDRVTDELSTDKPVAIYLFGKVGLTNEGREIEQLFNKLKQILALITYHTVENLGIPTAELSRQLWAELPEENVASARGTNIKKLRTALQDVPCVQIIVENKLWKLHSNDDMVYIDFKAYRELSALMWESLKANEYNEALINRYLSIIERGRFLSDFETDWADDLKNKISEEIIDILKFILTRHSKRLSKKMKIRISDGLFIQDELNLDALRTRLQLYRDESNLGLAKKTFDAYSRKYKLIYNEDFSISFNDLMQD